MHLLDFFFRHCKNKMVHNSQNLSGLLSSFYQYLTLGGLALSAAQMSPSLLFLPCFFFFFISDFTKSESKKTTDGEIFLLYLQLKVLPPIDWLVLQLLLLDV